MELSEVAKMSNGTFNPNYSMVPLLNWPKYCIVYSSLCHVMQRLVSSLIFIPIKKLYGTRFNKRIDS